MPDGFWFFICLVAGLLYWWNANGAKQRAVVAGRAACVERGLQFLDGSVMRSSMSLKRDERGNPHFWRRYEFEFSADGANRHHGFIVLVGNRVTNVQLDPYPINTP